MAYMDVLERGIAVNFHGTFVLNAVYKEITRWAKTNQYNVVETAYESSKQDGLTSLNVGLNLGKKVSDYEGLGMAVTIKASELKDKKVNNKIMQEGDISITINTFIKRDSDDVWSRKNYTRFFREFYDKFIGGSKMEAEEKQIANDVKSLKNAIKDFLGAPNFKK